MLANDFSEPVLRELAPRVISYLGGRLDKFTFLVGNMHELHMLALRVDLVVCYYAVHHLFLPEHFFRQLRKILTPNDFGSLAEVEAGLLAFQDHYQQIATPFEWRFTKSDLDLLLKRLATHEPAPALAA